MLRVEPEIKANYVATGQVNLAFSHVLDHGTASQVAHQAAECAGAQSPAAFWEMHDLLFARQSQLWNAGTILLSDWAAELGLDATAFATCMDDTTIAARVAQIDQSRRDAGIRLRPTFRVNDRLVEGALPYAQFEQLFADLGVTQ